MLVDFYQCLRENKVPVSLREFLDLHEALGAHLVYADIDDFYLLARTIMVRDKRQNSVELVADYVDYRIKELHFS